ncbi:hypothetical protein OEZ85_011297 [Tetradesmus obliquus]|uniref:Amidohydrolase-related domain-containing protein n=1 Tax=Tetradesmus obliquus TaxID=3088 RepID=A0ABY8TQ16_TETOB|nr:hypothetical protein OEZ85_011297 [Tetradesmus obliquus]
MEPYSVVPPGDGALEQQEPLLARDSFRYAKQRRAQRCEESPLVLTNCRLLDTRTGQCSSFGHSVVIKRGRIEAVDAQLPPQGAVVINCSGLVLMPGLCDAHVHVTATTANLAGLYSLPESLVTARAADILEGMLSRGFTTVRDAGGADWGLAEAVEEGSILGPRLLFTGHALSQTGGHGDFRGKGEDCCCCGAALRGIGRVCDGVDACRAAARDELRKGAHCIKVMASGGVASPTDRLTNTQFSLEELTAICQEAEAAGTYVAAHAYTPPAIKRALSAGVRSIEHGNWLDEETASLMANLGAYLVPTTITYAALQREGVAAGMPQELVDKVGEAVKQGQRSMAVARSCGVKMCYGSDLLGALHKYQSEEFLLRTEAGMSAPELVAAATLHCAQLFNKEGELGELLAGAAADLILVDGDPLQDIACLAGSSSDGSSSSSSSGGGSNIPLVIKDGLLAKVPHVGLLDVNRQLVR